MRTRCFYFFTEGDFPTLYQDQSLILLERLVFAASKRRQLLWDVTFLVGCTNWNHVALLSGYIELSDALSEDEFKVVLFECFGDDEISGNVRKLIVKGVADALGAPECIRRVLEMNGGCIYDYFTHGILSLDTADAFLHSDFAAGRTVVGQEASIVRGIVRRCYEWSLF